MKNTNYPITGNTAEEVARSSNKRLLKITEELDVDEQSIEIGNDGLQVKIDPDGGLSKSSNGLRTDYSVVRKRINQVITNSDVLQNDTVLRFAVGNNESWSFTCVLFVAIAAAADMKIQWSVPSSATMMWAATTRLTNMDVGAAGDPSSYPVLTETDSKVFGGGGVNVKLMFFITGIVNASTAGNVQLQWAQNTANASDLTVYKNSYIQAWKLG